MSPLPLYAPSANWDVAWILKLLLTVGQGFTIVVLGVMLWRQRAQGNSTQKVSPSFPEGWTHILSLYPSSLGEKVG